MEVFMLVDDDVLPFEPLASTIQVNDLYVGVNSIFCETLENLWHSGISHITLVVEKYKTAQFEKYRRRFNFGRRDGYVDVDILPLNVDRILPGSVLREVYSTVDRMEEFILIYWNTLLTVPLYEPLELHRARRRDSPRYAMSAVYIQDSQNRSRSFSHANDDCIIIYNGEAELLAYQTGTDKMRLSYECLQNLRGDTSMSIRYDLCKTGIYICNKNVAEHYTNWFEHEEIDEYITDCLSKEFKTDEIYITILQHDVLFPNYPPAIIIRTPKDYHTIHMEYIARFQGNKPLTHKQVMNHQPQFGPMVQEQATFINNSAFVPPFKKTKYLFTAVFNSIVGQNVTLGKCSTVDRCIIFDDVTIGENCKIKDSIIMNGVQIEDDTVIPPGSIVCSETTINNKLMDGLSGSLRASKVPSKYIDLTNDGIFNSVSNKKEEVYIWPIDAFGDIETTYIGKSYYDMMNLKPPIEPSTAPESDYEGDEQDDCYSNASNFHNADSHSEVDTLQSDEEVEGTTKYHVSMHHEVVDELCALTVDCLENPNQLPHKVLEIKNLKISHNLQTADMVKVVFEYGLSWIIEHTAHEEELQEQMEKSQFKEFLDAFEYRMDEEEHYSDVLKVCTNLKRGTNLFSHVCEALYHVDIMEFEGLQSWLLKNNVTGPRIESFAKWVAED